MLDIFILLVLFQLKHFIADYPLQSVYMLGKMKNTDWVKPLMAHSFVHAIGTLLIVSLWDLQLGLILALVDFTLHFIVDRLKADPKLGGQFTPDQSYFWWALGLDQMTHHLINYSFIAIILYIL